MLAIIITPGLPASWDFGAHIAPIAKLALWLRGGVYPLEFPEFWFGYGLLAFYPPVFYLASALVSVITGGDVYVAIKVALAISFVGGAYGAYFAARSALDNRTASLVAAVAYTFAGYHLRNIIAQGVYPASFVFMSMPWILAFWYLSIKRKDPKYLALGGLFLSLGILSHLITGLLTAAFFAMATVILLVLNLVVRNFRTAALLLLSTAAVILLAVGLSAWWLIPMLRYLPSTYLSSGLIVYDPNDRPFPLDPWTFIRRNLPVWDLVTRRPIDFDGGSHLPSYLGIVLFILGSVGTVVLVEKLVRTLLKRERKLGLLADFAGISALAFVFSILFSTSVQVFVLPLWWLDHNMAISLMRIQLPGRMLFLATLGGAMMAGYAFAAFLESKYAARVNSLSDKINLDMNFAKLLAALLIVLMIVDTYSYAASPFNYYASYPPYNSQGLDKAYMWLASQNERFRVVDPLAGVHSHMMEWDTLAFPGGWSLSPEYYQYSQKNFKALNITNQSPQKYARELGYFGVKYAVGHQADPKLDGAGFAGTDWKPILQFNEVYIFKNPYFRPIIEVVNDTQGPQSKAVGTAIIDTYSPNSMKIVLSSINGPSYLVFKFFKQLHWRAYLDGKPADIQESDWGFMFLLVNSSTREAVFTFEGPELSGIAISLLTLVVVIVLTVISLRKKRKAIT